MKYLRNPASYIWAVLLILPLQVLAIIYLMRSDQMTWAMLVMAAADKSAPVPSIFLSSQYLIIWLVSVGVDIALLWISVYLLGKLKANAPISKDFESSRVSEKLVTMN